jgi:predicted GNAT superfamily acetyltransferase
VPADVQLRPYSAGDAESVLALNQANLHGVGPLDPERLRWLVTMTSQALVAEDHGALAGFALVFPPGTDYDSSNYAWFAERWDEFGYLDRIVVAPTHRRRGIAGLLYDAAEDGARASGRLLCEVYVEPPNEASLAFHAARGYTEVGRLLQANGKTCSMLAKELTGQ